MNPNMRTTIIMAKQRQHKRDEEELQWDLNIMQWCQKWRININRQKHRSFYLKTTKKAPKFKSQ